MRGTTLKFQILSKFLISDFISSYFYPNIHQKLHLCLLTYDHVFIEVTYC